MLKAAVRAGLGLALFGALAVPVSLAQDQPADPPDRPGREISVWLELARPVAVEDWTFEDVKARIAVSQRGQRVTSPVLGNSAILRLLPGRHILFLFGEGGLRRELPLDVDQIEGDRVSLTLEPARLELRARLPVPSNDAGAYHRWQVRDDRGRAVPLPDTGPSVVVDLPGGDYIVEAQTPSARGEARLSLEFGATRTVVIDLAPKP